MKFKLRLRKGILRKVLRQAIAIGYATAFRKKAVALDILPAPKRILVFGGAHIGDMVISTSILPVLASAYPDAEIGFLTGSWAAMVLTGHPGIDHVHIVDHWWHNRSKKSFREKRRQYKETLSRAFPVIRSLEYDMALCVYPYFLPDFMELAWKAKIPVRLGFSESMYASLATATVPVPKNIFLHQGAIQAEVLRPLNLAPEHLCKRHPVLADCPESAVQEVCALLNVQSLSETRYRIVHIGTGARNREQPIDFWRELAQAEALRCMVIFTGHGDYENSKIEAITAGIPNCVNACGKLSWQGYVAAVRGAEMLYGVESMAGHVAGAVGTPCIVVYSGASGVARWRPEGPVTVMTNHLSCAPCNLPEGCESMACVRGIKSVDLIAIESDLIAE